MLKQKTKVDKDPIAYFFGYGSLMYPWGINGRGMNHFYKWTDLKTAWLTGFKRGMFARFPSLEWGPLLYYGLLNSPKDKVLGVLLPLFSQYDLAALLQNEHAHPKQKYRLYTVERVNTKLTGMEIQLPVYALISPEPPKDGRITQDYVEHVWIGAGFWGEQFMQDFVKTGGVSPRWVQDNQPKPRYISKLEEILKEKYARGSNK